MRMGNSRDDRRGENDPRGMREGSDSAHQVGLHGERRSRPATQRPSYAGRGPRGYRRPDERIAEDLNEQLTVHQDIDATDVEVQIAKGIVTLSGIVEDRHEKRIAQEIAEFVSGVTEVHNELKVRHGLLARITGERATDREVILSAEREAQARGGRASG
jgi:osmotically-inducible protein OsmY